MDRYKWFYFGLTLLNIPLGFLLSHIASVLGAEMTTSTFTSMSQEVFKMWPLAIAGIPLGIYWIAVTKKFQNTYTKKHNPRSEAEMISELIRLRKGDFYDHLFFGGLIAITVGFIMGCVASVP